MATDYNKLKLDVNEPDIYKKRSYISNLKHGSHFTCNASDLVPMDAAWPVIPGDTWKLRQTTFIRMTNPPKTPTMDQLVVDYYYFYTPYRILDGKWDDFITGNKGTQWNNLSTETVAYIGIYGAANSYDLSGTLYDYLHMLPAVVTLSGSTGYHGYIQAYPVMNYYRIWNEYFRVEAFQAEISGIYTAGGTRLLGYVDLSAVVTAKAGYRSTYGVGLSNLPSLYNGVLCETARLGDYFSTALPAPIKGGETAILESLTIGNGMNTVLFNFDDPVANGASATYSHTTGMDTNTASLQAPNSTYLQSISGPVAAVGSNTITALKQAFAIDAIKTLDARYGQKITDYTYGHFGVVLPDYRVPRPEYLGKRRFYFNINQVIQSSETSSTSPQGNAGAWGQTLDKKQYIFTKSFTEFGIIQGVMTIRVLNHSYAQGLDRQFLKFNRFDFYEPALANISDLPIKKVEMYVPSLGNQTSLSDWINYIDNNAWGFQEAWSEYKFMPNRVAGLMSPLPSQNLSQWTYTDNYASQPTLNSRWLVEPINNIDNTLMIPSTTAPQFIVDCFFDIDAYRPMPLHSDIGVIKGW